MKPETTSERLVFFTDAVAAIAITLLILPLLEVIPEAAGEHESLGGLVRDHRAEFGAFLLSFSVIFRLWWAHHRIFQHVSLLRTPIVLSSVVWTLAIVILPIPTAIIILGNFTAFLAQVVATTIGAVFADTVNYWAFLLMFLSGPLDRVLKSRWR